jgi:hypothetical protein
VFKTFLQWGIIYVGIWRRLIRVASALSGGICSGKVLILAALILASCGDHGLLPSTVDPGPDFSVADVRFDEGFYYCKVEPVLFANSCGAGDATQGDATNGCHHNVTGFRLATYAPLIAEQCNGGVVPGTASFPAAAQQNYQSAQGQMRRDPDVAPLLQRPTQGTQHPRKIFDLSSADADVIRQWATQYSTQ